jgi:glycosyltransferase involved in cell wall biosynthesis
MPRPIYFDTRWNGNHGIGRFSQELQRRLPDLKPLRIAGPKLSPIDPIASSLALAGLREGCYFSPGFNQPLRSPIPFAFTIHDLTYLRVPQESSVMRRLYYTTIVRPATRRAWRVLTVSEYSRRDILEWSGLPAEAVVVVGNGVSADFKPGPPLEQREPYLLHVGRRGGNKNIGNLVRGYALSSARRDLTLVFTGDADAETLHLATQAGVGERVRFAGPVGDAELVKLYQRSRALLYPSLHEGFGLPIVEAMATGTPCVQHAGRHSPAGCDGRHARKGRRRARAAGRPVSDRHRRGGEFLIPNSKLHHKRSTNQ